MVEDVLQSVYALAVHVYAVYLLFLIDVYAQNIAFDVSERNNILVRICGDCSNLIIVIPHLFLAVDDIAHISERFH